MGKTKPVQQPLNGLKLVIVDLVLNQQYDPENCRGATPRMKKEGSHTRATGPHIILQKHAHWKRHPAGLISRDLSHWLTVTGIVHSSPDQHASIRVYSGRSMNRSRGTEPQGTELRQRRTHWAGWKKESSRAIGLGLLLLRIF